MKSRMSKPNPQIDIAVLKEQVTQITKSMISIQADITVINGKLDDTFVRKTDYDVGAKANQDTHVDIDSRLRVLENWKWWLAGAIGVLGFVVTIMANHYFK